MRLKQKFIIAGLTIAFLGLSQVPTQASAKTWHYTEASSNSFSKKKFNKAFIYGYHEYTNLYKTVPSAKKQEPDTIKIITTSKSFTAKKTSSNKVFEVIYSGNHYFMNTSDTRLYRYNTWRSGHKLISTVKPTQKNKVVLKAHTHFRKSQHWLYKHSDNNISSYTWYRLSKKGNWYVDHSK